QAAHVVGGVANDDAVVVDLQVGMVVLAVGDEGQRVHERHGPVVVLEPVGPADRRAVVDQRPVGYLGQQFTQAGLAQPVFFAAPRHAVGAGEGDQVVHGSSGCAFLQWRSYGNAGAAVRTVPGR